MAGHLNTLQGFVFETKIRVWLSIRWRHTHTQIFLIRACVLCINREEGLGQCIPFSSLPKFLLPFSSSSRNPNREEEINLIILLTLNQARQLDKARRKEIVSSVPFELLNFLNKWSGLISSASTPNPCSTLCV